MNVSNPSRFSYFWKTKRFLFTTFVACLGLVYGTAEPQSFLGQALFHISYASPPSRPECLRIYHGVLLWSNGGYVPPAVDAFLSGRLSQCRGTREWSAIIDFHLAQTSWRWGDALSQTNDQLKGEIIDHLMRRSRSVPPDESGRILLLVESLRRADPFSKAQFIHSRFSDKSIGPTIRERFDAWWGEGRSWPTNKSVNPLEGTDIIVHAP